ncbi:MAG TPA: hypothetical protein VKK79_04045, partial [Candidatus Lokiarchaeia archaeon]|nr:hypothetical protein [Candidatus Lokiarchaeia archaeon]
MGHEGEKNVGSEEDPLSRDWSDQPTILTPEEVEQLRSPAPQRRKLKFLFLFLGLALAVPSVVMLALGIDLKATVAGINLNPVVFFIVLLVGMSFVAKYFTLAPYPLRENSLTALRTAQYREPVEFPLHLLSYSYSRLAAAALFLVVGIMDLIVLSPYMGNPGAAVFGGTYNGTGTAVVLGGVSFFYPVGIPVLAAGIGLAIYLSVARFVGRFARSEHFWFFHEFRLLAPWLTEVPRADAEAFRYQNTQLGPKVLWPLWILPFSFIVLQYGLPLFNQQRATTNILSTMMTLSAVCALLCCVLLLLWPQDYFEIATKEVLYEMYFAPAINPGEVRENMQAFFGFPPTQTRQTGEESTSNLGQVDTTQRNYTQLVLGGLLLAL